MPRPFDACPLTKSVLKTAADAIHISSSYTHSPDTEWFCALYLNECQEVLGYTIYPENECPIRLNVEEIYKRAMPYQPTSLITVRSHPHHGPLPLVKAINWVETLQAVGLNLNIPLRDHIATYTDGTFSFRERARAIRASGFPSLSLCVPLSLPILSLML